MEKQATKRGGKETRVSLTAHPGHEHIALLAYALWQERGCPEGSSEEDWFLAERELAGRGTNPVPKPLQSMAVMNDARESSGNSHR
jgi:hypothetical protein